MKGRSISKVHLICNDANQFYGEAFVMFARFDDIEQALPSIAGKRIQNKFVKVFRSSLEQFQNYCDSVPHLASMDIQTDRFGSVSNLGKDA